MSKTTDRLNLNTIRFSLCLKVIIVAWAFYFALQTDAIATSLFYLVVAIVFAGLFVFQLDFYRKKKAEQEKQ
jgi:membrane protein YdbS with pleckstrin-like domain